MFSTVIYRGHFESILNYSTCLLSFCVLENIASSVSTFLGWLFVFEVLLFVTIKHVSFSISIFFIFVLIPRFQSQTCWLWISAPQLVSFVTVGRYPNCTMLCFLIWQKGNIWQLCEWDTNCLDIRHNILYVNLWQCLPCSSVNFSCHHY